MKLFVTIGIRHRQKIVYLYFVNFELTSAVVFNLSHMTTLPTMLAFSIKDRTSLHSWFFADEIAQARGVLRVEL